ncbi:hypothetical protein P8Q88_10205 [Qipengyuania sp. XHP0207]|uniref:hypothetical protein n=1 Tax=Qipengyuania sp. XHP0207 TaxID=3038078 RepID=UPI00241E37CE|nr:hypothetical protein [Qipengyuania sp. XHP0207]MDG5748550.1 hypothetical protein [Qipengyuania sp. XHP0207]
MSERRLRPDLPISSRFAERLDDRRRWFERWLSRWQLISGQEIVEIDSFGGEPIRTGGLEYSGTIVHVYWDAIVRGLRKEIVAQFEWLEQQVAGKPLAQAEQIIDVCAGKLVTFAERIRRDAIAKDSILRSRNGVRAPASDEGRWDGADRNAVIRQASGMLESLKASQPTASASVRTPPFWSRIPQWVQFTAAAVTIIAGLVALLG